MKKELLVYSLAALSLFGFTGCNKTEAQAITTLENQIKRIENVVNNAEKDDISSVSALENNTTSQSFNLIQNYKANAYTNMTQENQLKKEVLHLNSVVKSCLNKNLKLGKTKTNAIKKLSANISSNLSKFNETKDQIKNSVKNINQSLKVPKINVVGAESEYITLNGNMAERYVYLCNIYDNLEQAYFLICDCCNDETVEQETVKNQTNYNQSNPTKQSRFRKNIDSYAPNTNQTNDEEKNSSTEERQTKDIRNIDSFNNLKPPVNDYYNPAGYPQNGYYNGYGYNGYAMNNGYANGYYNRFRRFNPNGNTDTFYPSIRNIDTYRIYPGINYPVSGTPINKEDTDSDNIRPNSVINMEDNAEEVKKVKIPENEIFEIKKETKPTQLEESTNLIEDKIDILKNIKQGE